MCTQPCSEQTPKVRRETLPAKEMNSGDAQTSVDDVSTRKEKPCPDKGSINLNPVTDEEEPLLQPSNGNASLWKATLNILNSIEGVGFLSDTVRCR
ncbi:hypothetical protein OS493_040350 [Desmophyllum pertusum]|uniref:Uncharacterized protein n=1 Tax=Desmophyllum pertusum TaxID=174260 RepID=A0A9X0CPY2_9CNID|nr:hypothetical protein OS493_040350 [Desmophyllum pertusum]